jgi:hypothetical protein
MKKFKANISYEYMQIGVNNDFLLVIECHLQRNNAPPLTQILWLLTSVKFSCSPSIFCLPNFSISLENENFSFDSSSVTLVDYFLIDFLKINDQTIVSLIR